MIIVDSREPKRIIDEITKQTKNFKIDTLAYGDYVVIGNDSMIVIERKDIFDLVKSMNDGRLWEQMKGMEKYTDAKKVLLIEGNIYKLYGVYGSKMAFRLVGMMTSIIKGWNYTIIMTADTKMTVRILVSLDTKLGKANDEGIKKVSGIIKQHRTTDEELIDVLMGFEGIGGKKAEMLLKEFGSIYGIVKAKKSELVKVIGEKLGEDLYRKIRLGYGGIDNEKDAENNSFEE